jgi:adenine-specific DNA methylase
MAIPYRDGTVDAVICDPPYYDMIEYADASDYYYVWLRRILAEIQPDLFGEDVGTAVGPNLQNKDDEIIVRRVYNGGVKHDREFYENSLSRAFKEAKRVLRNDGHLVVVFGHSDPEAWKRLLAALHDAGFVITSSWPSRTENSHTGVASIKVTVTIGCRVAPAKRNVATAAQVDREVTEAVKSAVRDWERDGLAFTDQLMASIGRGMEVYGKYSKILKPDGSEAELDRYLTLSRVAVRDAMALKLDELPLETFDKRTRFAVFWLRLNGLTTVSKGESRFLAQADSLSFDDVRTRLLKEGNRGFKLRLDPPESVSTDSSTIEVARAMAGAWDEGGTEAVASVIATAEFAPNDPHLWAIQRNVHAISSLAQRAADTAIPSSTQLTFANLLEESS